MENIYKVETFIIFCMIIISILVYAISFTEKPVSIYYKMNAKHYANMPVQYPAIFHDCKNMVIFR